MFLDKKTVLKVVWLNPGLNLTYFKELRHEPQFWNLFLYYSDSIKEIPNAPLEYQHSLS